MARRRKNLNLRKIDYIFTEGRTEVIYLNRVKRAFRCNASVKLVESKKQSIDLVKHAISTLNSKSKKEKERIGNVYVMFDKDSEEICTIDNAKKTAEKNDIKVIFSNECFDLWILAHFDGFTDRFMSRREVYENLSKKMEVKDYVNHKADEKLFEKFLTDEKLINTISKYTSDDWLHNRTHSRNPYSNVSVKMNEIFENKRK